MQTLAESGLGTVSAFFCDEHCRLNCTPCDEAFVKTCEQLKPDFLFLFPVSTDIVRWCGDPPQQKALHMFPRKSTFEFIKKALDIPIITCNGDAYGEDSFAYTEELSLISDRILIMEPNSDFMERARTPEKYVLLWCPVVSSIFCSNGHESRDIDVSFIGRAHYSDSDNDLPPDNPLHQYLYRLVFLEKLIAAGIPVFRAGGQQQLVPLSTEQVAEYLRRSKISLNFSYFSPERRLIRGRVWEALNCGSLLLEEDNSSTSYYLEPNKHYIPFNGVEDAAEKIRFYLQNPALLENIAQSGCTVARENYGARIFWERVIDIALGDRSAGHIYDFSLLSSFLYDHGVDQACVSKTIPKLSLWRIIRRLPYYFFRPHLALRRLIGGPGSVEAFQEALSRRQEDSSGTDNVEALETGVESCQEVDAIKTELESDETAPQEAEFIALEDEKLPNLLGELKQYSRELETLKAELKLLEQTAETLRSRERNMVSSVPPIAKDVSGT